MAAKVGVTPPEPFPFSKPEEWSRWIRRFERFRIASKLNEEEDNAQLNMLLYCMGDRADDILQSFKYAEGEREDYATVKKKLDDYFIPQRNVIYERALFNSRKQEPGEPVEEFITALHTLVEYCDYGDLRDQMVRDRIVVGLANAKLSEKLQLDRKLTLDSAVTQARQDETVRKQQATLRGATKDSSVSAVHKGKHLPRGKKIRNQPRPRESQSNHRVPSTDKHWRCQEIPRNGKPSR